MQIYISLWIIPCQRNMKLLFAKDLLYSKQVTLLVFLKYSKVFMYVKAPKMELITLLFLIVLEQ